MWSPTHIQVTILKAHGLLIKGRNGTNNCFVTIALGKNTFKTSQRDKATENVEWFEECELRIPDRGNRAELVLTVLHHSNVVDEFLGQVTLPLNEMEVYERPRERRYKLQSKPGKDKKDKDRGELEVRIAFTVNPETGSMADLSKKEKKGSMRGLGGSLLSLGTLEKGKGIKSFAKSIGSKMHLSNKPKKDKYGDGDSITAGSSLSINTPAVRLDGPRRFVPAAGVSGKEGNVDPGVNSEDEDEFVFDNLSHKSSGSSLNIARSSNQQLGVANLPPPSPLSKHSTSAIDLDIKLRSQTLPPPSKPPRVTPEPPAAPSTAKVDEWETKLYGKNLDIGSSDSLKRRSWESSRVPLAASNPSKTTNIDETTNSEHILASTAPTTPNLEDQKHAENLDKPKPLPRSATLESIEEKERDEKAAAEKTEKRFLNKLKYFSKKDRAESVEDLKSKYGTSPKEQTHRFGGERIIIGHENDVGRRSEQKISPELLKKYDGKTREDMMLVASDLEMEVKLQKLKMKEMEDYLDDLLLRVMETHPKILQNPYRNQMSAKSG